MKTTNDCMNECLSAHMDCIKRWSGWGIPTIIFFTSALMCAMAYDYIARGEY